MFKVCKVVENSGSKQDTSYLLPLAFFTLCSWEEWQKRVTRGQRKQGNKLFSTSLVESNWNKVTIQVPSQLLNSFPITILNRFKGWGEITSFSASVIWLHRLGILQITLGATRFEAVCNLFMEGAHWQVQREMVGDRKYP